MVKKVLFMGRPAMGKTTIIKIIFENEDPSLLVLFPLESTLGKKFTIYDFLDLKLSILDTAGQSLPTYLIDKDLQENIFGDTSKLIYLFDYKMWLSNPEEIIKDVKQIYDINKNNDYDAEIILFFHKIDLIPQVDNEKLDVFEKQILEQLNLPIDLKIFFTSIHSDFIYTIFNALYKVLSNLSDTISNLERIINEFFKELSLSICFIIDKNNNIISQLMSNDFDLTLVREFQKKIFNSISENENQDIIENFPKMVEINSNFFFDSIVDISNVNESFKNIILFSQNLNNNQLQELLIKIKEKLVNNYSNKTN